MGYEPPFELTNTMLKLVSDISEKVGEISIHKNLDTKPHLRKNNRIRSIHSSLKIEANSLELSDVRDVINGRKVSGNSIEILEVKNAYQAYEEIEKINPYSIKDLKKIHGIMTEGIISESGVFRKGNEGVFSGDKCIFVAPPPKAVKDLIVNLMKWSKANEGKVHPLIMSAVFHYEFVFIHPFADGNGRMARLWHTAFLYRWHSIFEYIPLESQIEKFQDKYYDAIAQCHINGNSNVFIEFMLKMIKQTIDEFSLQLKNDKEGISEYVSKMLESMDYEVEYSAFEIMEKVGLKSRASFRKNYLEPALKKGFVKMTLPDKPTSKNQKYIKI